MVGDIVGFFLAKTAVCLTNFSISSKSAEIKIGGAVSVSLVTLFDDICLLGSGREVNSLFEIAIMGTPSKARSLDESLNGRVCGCASVLSETCLDEFDTSWFDGQ